MQNNDIKQAINLCVTKRIPFVAYKLPYQKELIFFSNPSKKGTNNTKFHISFFANKSDSPITIYNEYDSIQTIKHCREIPSNVNPKIKPHKASTDFDIYTDSVNNIISQLKVNGYKVVFSKVTCGKHKVVNWAELAIEYFEHFVTSFRYIYYTQDTGCWIGASPEVLITKDNKNSPYKTMALAGTRNKSVNEYSWDEKNLSEHKFVTDYIVEKSKEIGLSPFVHDAENIVFGDIEHLCHKIDLIGNLLENPIKIANHFSPTPALLGYPIEYALNTLNNFEKHPRHCYGGYIAIEKDDSFHSYVNLRCAHIDDTNYCIYSGGGITKDSIAIEEWIETENKIKILKEILA